MWFGTAGAASPEAKCEARKNQESGKYAFCLHNAEAKQVKSKGQCSIAATACYRDDECPPTQTCQKDTTKYDEAVANCEDNYASKWNKLEQQAAEAAATCPDGLAQAVVKEVIDECVSNVAAGLAGDGLQDCTGDLDSCADELGTCASDLDACNSSLTSTQASLATCNSDLSTCNGDLSTCNSNYTTCTGDLATCNSNYGTCTGDLATCSTDLATCSTDLATAQACGDGDIDGGEVCDQGDLNGATCASEGFAGGTLSCGANCAYDTSGCYAARFVDNGDGTISDYATGLMWQKKADYDGPSVNCTSAAVCPDPHDADNHYTWSTTSPNPNGTAYTVLLVQLNAGSGFAGNTDWRLPTRDELQSIVDYADATGPTVNAAFDSGCTGSCTIATCSCTGISGHWSSSTIVPSPSNAYVVGFGQGLVVDDAKTFPNYVRAVRTGL
jgi:hypothetical protein